MGLADTLGQMISAFDSTNKQNTQQDMQMQKIDVSNFWKQAQMTFDAGKFLTNTRIKLDNMDMEERKRVFGAYDTTIDNITGQIGSINTLLSKETNQSVINSYRKQLEVLGGRLKNVEAVSEKLYPTERKMFDAGQAGYDIDSLQQEGNQLYGEDVDEKDLDSKASQGQRGDNGRQDGINQAGGQIADKIPSSRQLVRRDNIPSEMLAKDSALPSGNLMEGFIGLDALKQQVQDLISQVQGRLGDGQDSQPLPSLPLNIPGARQPMQDIQPMQPDIQPDIQQDVPLTTAQREAEKYTSEQGIKFEQENYDRYLTGLTSKYKYLDTKGVSIEDEIKTTETNILEKQKLIQWIDMMASTGRTRAWSPTDILGTGIQQLMAKTVPGFESILKKPKSVKTAWGKRYSTDTTSMQNDIERAKIKLDELNQLSELYTPGGGIPSEAQELINTGMTAEQRNTAQRRSKIFGAYRQ